MDTSSINYYHDNERTGVASDAEVWLPGLGLWYWNMRVPLPGSNISTQSTIYSANAAGLEEALGYTWAEWNGNDWIDVPAQTADSFKNIERLLFIRGAGADCVGFAQRVASYDNGEAYAWPTIGTNFTETEPETNTRYYPYTAADAIMRNDALYELYNYRPFDEDGYGHLILDREAYETLLADVATLLSRVRPGDVMYYIGGHIAVVREVLRNDEGEVEDLSSIRLIESTYGSDPGLGSYAHVVGIRGLNDIHALGGTINPRQWRVVRLRAE